MMNTPPLCNLGSFRLPRLRVVVAVLLFAAAGLSPRAAVVINEIHYHPVEEAAFDAQGLPALDLTEDVHEFVEIHNASDLPVSLQGWRLDSAIEFQFPPGTTLPARGHLVVAANPNRLAAVPQYHVETNSLLGPYTGRLGNGGGELVRLRDAGGLVVDAVNYSSSFPWPTSADAFGASRRWTGINALSWQYRGRSLERIRADSRGNDPANWMASVFPGDPTPGAPNSVSGRDVLPVVTLHHIAAVESGVFPVRDGQSALVDVTFSSVQGLSGARLEYFVDQANRTDEPRTSMVMTGTPPVLSAVIPAQAPRSVVRYRVLASRSGTHGTSEEPVLPRTDDTFGWQAYFVVPARALTNDTYDLFISTNSISQLMVNLRDNPRDGWIPPVGTPPIGRYNNTEPAMLAYNGRVYDVQVRHSGSFYRRDFSRNSFKVELAASQKLDGHSTLLILEKGTENVFGHRLFESLGWPTSKVRPVDLYLNNLPRLSRLEFEEHDDDLLGRWADQQKQLHPDEPKPGIGRLWKSSGYGDVGPFGPGDGSQLPPKPGWTSVQRYEWVYSSKDSDWEGYVPFKQIIDELNTARGPGPQPDIASMRAYVEARWDVPRLLDYMVVRCWMSAGDDVNHNYMIWLRSDGLLQMLPWDFDGEIGDIPRSIFAGEDQNRFKDLILKAYRKEFIERLWWMNNTYLQLDNLNALGLGHPNLAGFAPERSRFINGQTLGGFERPERPANLFPAGGESVLAGAEMRTTAYTHTSTASPAHLSTCWQIRSESGSFVSPVYSLTSTVQLVTCPIPFDSLQPGQIYFWRAIHHDAQGHPSIPSQESGFRYGGSFRRTELVSLDSEWAYLENGTNISKLWRDAGFDDASWKRGRAILGVNTSSVAPPIPVRTPLPLGQRVYYLRRHFRLPASPTNAVLQLRHFLDDGAVFYLNGREFLRVNMSSIYPANGVPATSLATREINVPVLEQPFTVPLTNAVEGDNVLAVQLHQYKDSSGDLLFGASLVATLETAAGGLRLSEIAASGGGPDHPQDDIPWVELANASALTVSLDGCRLTDDPVNPSRFVFPTGILLGPGERIVVRASETMTGPLIAPFSLSTLSGQLWLFGPDGSGGLLQLDSVLHGLQPAGYSLGRITPGTGPWLLMSPTPGSPNRAARMGSPASLRINEWMASPKKGPDWFELFNPELLPVAIGGLYLTDDPLNPTNSPIAALSFLAPFSFTQFFADGSHDLGPLHTDFKLSASGESIGLFEPSGRAIDLIRFELQAENVSEGRMPDGAEARARFGSGGTPGFSNRGDSDGDGLPDDWELLYGLAAGVADSALDTDGDGAGNLQEFLAGTDPNDPRSVLRLALDRDPGATDGEGTIRVRFEGVAGRIYELQQSRVPSGDDWTPVKGFAPTAAGTQTATLPVTSGASYLRLLLLR